MDCSNFAQNCPRHNNSSNSKIKIYIGTFILCFERFGNNRILLKLLFKPMIDFEHIRKMCFFFCRCAWWKGTEEIGCWGFYSRPFSFCEMLFCFFNSLLTSGFNYGARQYPRVREAYLLAIKWNLIVSAIGFFLLQCFPQNTSRRLSARRSM